MKKLNLFYYGLIQKVWMFATWCIPSGATRTFYSKKDISVIQKYSTAVMHTWGFEQFFRNIQQLSSFFVFNGIFRPAFRTNTYDVW